jgi:hypothetical protein
MNTIALNDLSMNVDLDSKALKAVTGGRARQVTYRRVLISNRFRRQSRKLIGFVWTKGGLKRKYSFREVQGHTRTTHTGGYLVI